MLSFLAASAAEFFRLLIFVFDLDLFKENIIATIASASSYQPFHTAKN